MQKHFKYYPTTRFIIFLHLAVWGAINFGTPPVWPLVVLFSYKTNMMFDIAAGVKYVGGGKRRGASLNGRIAIDCIASIVVAGTAVVQSQDAHGSFFIMLLSLCVLVFTDTNSGQRRKTTKPKKVKKRT